MLGNLLSKAFGSANDRVIRKYMKTVQKINDLEKEISSLSDQALQNRTQWLKERLAQGETLNDILPDAFATVREGAVRVFGMRPFDVQLIGGMALHNGLIAEMKTGEGKTLMATLPIYLNALTGRGVHLVTVNDYLVQRDSQWMGQLYNFLGLSVGCIVHGLTDNQRRQAYNADITYATNHELGFDYLRDNMKFRLQDMVQRPFHFAIVDEVDSILIDEARTPLIISGPADDSSEEYKAVNKLIPRLEETDYEKDEKQRSVIFTDAGLEKMERLLEEAGLLNGTMLYDVHNISLVHHVNQALKAHKLFTRDADYIVKDDKVMIIDEFTGRIMEGRRYSDGLHQALEAKEEVHIEQENQTLASITYQNYFRLYEKLAGMTGTAQTEAAEFEEIYKLQTLSIPTNRPVARKDHEDEVYLTAEEKYDAVAELIQECRNRQQPVLVGTTSIEKSELISKILNKKNIPHQVLNARYHEQEAMIIADAGCPGAVTIATNMAGRGTDIKLGGNLETRLAKELAQSVPGREQEKRIAQIKADIARDEQIVKEAGGLYVIGTERHESRRIDNQLRGRSGRQGDPGASKFFISLQDDLMRIFGSERLDSMLRKLGVEKGEAISHSWVTKALERAQQKVEARNFEVRKHLLRYDDVMNDQRKIIYEQRRELMAATDINHMIVMMRDEVIEDLIEAYAPSNALAEQWNIDALEESIQRIFVLELPIKQWALDEGISVDLLDQRIKEAASNKILEKENKYGPSIMRTAERTLLLRLLDHTWKDHLLSLDQLRQGINLRAYAQNNPLNEYKREAFELFESMMTTLREEITQTLMHFEMEVPDESALNAMLEDQTDFSSMQESDGNSLSPDQEDGPPPSEEEINAFIAHVKATYPRNAPCPCGSGQKFKHCHGAIR